MATKCRKRKRVNSDVQVGDVEPLATIFGAGFGTSEIRAWFAAYRATVGQPLAFFNLDINWSARGWPRQLLSVAATVRAAPRVPLGIVYNGNFTNSSDQAWTEAAQNHFKYVEAGLGIVPDYAIIQSWMRYPRRMLPKILPEQCKLLLSYLKWRSPRAAWGRALCTRTTGQRPERIRPSRFAETNVQAWTGYCG